MLETEILDENMFFSNQFVLGVFYEQTILLGSERMKRLEFGTRESKSFYKHKRINKIDQILYTSFKIILYFSNCSVSIAFFH